MLRTVQQTHTTDIKTIIKCCSDFISAWEIKKKNEIEYAENLESIFVFQYNKWRMNETKGLNALSSKIILLIFSCSHLKWHGNAF